MSYVIEHTKEKIKQIEEMMKDPETSDTYREYAKVNLERYRNQLSIWENSNLDQIAADMKVILQHTSAVEDKYNCRSVKFMFWLADKLDKVGLNSLASKARNYTVHEIHAPVCSIVSSQRPELPPMPEHMTSIQRESEEFRRKEMAELKKYRDIWSNYADYQPTRWEMFKYRLSLIRRAFSRDLIKGIN